MPIYEYQCQTCESKFEVLESVNEDNQELKCPVCGACEPKKVFSSFASLGNAKTAACQTGSS